MVFAFAGLSTMTRFIIIDLTVKNKPICQTEIK